AEAGTGFEAVLARRPDYAPALVGAGGAAVRRGGLPGPPRHYPPAPGGGAGAPPGQAGPGGGGAPDPRRPAARTAGPPTARGARAAVRGGDEEGALAKYEKALEAAPELTDVRLAAADLRIRREDPVGAAAVLEADPTGDRTVLLRLGEVLTGLQAYDRALEAY